MSDSDKLIDSATSQIYHAAVAVMSVPASYGCSIPRFLHAFRAIIQPPLCLAKLFCRLPVCGARSGRVSRCVWWVRRLRIDQRVEIPPLHSRDPASPMEPTHSKCSGPGCSNQPLGAPGQQIHETQSSQDALCMLPLQSNLETSEQRPSLQDESVRSVYLPALLRPPCVIISCYG